MYHSVDYIHGLNMKKFSYFHIVYRNSFISTVGSFQSYFMGI